MNQTQYIKEILLSGEAITPIDALNRLGCFRLGARIWDLRQEGWNIETKIIKGSDGKHFAEYKLNKQTNCFQINVKHCKLCGEEIDLENDEFDGYCSLQCQSTDKMISNIDVRSNNE